MAEQDYGHCDECGNPLTADDAYRNICDAIGGALDDLDPYDQMAVLAFFTGRLIASFQAEDQKAVRRDLAREVTRETREWNIAGCDA